MNVYKNKKRESFLNKYFKKPNSGKVYWEKVISIFIVVFGFVFFAIYNQGKINEKEVLRDNFPCFTIGYVLGHNTNLRGSNTIDYRYCVSGKWYRGWDYISSRTMNLQGTAYLVKFYSKDASNAKILLNCPVPDNEESAPYSGWKQLPFRCNEIER